MASIRPVLVILGAVALLPIGFVTAKVIDVVVVQPVGQALPGIILEFVSDAAAPPQQCGVLVAGYTGQSRVARIVVCRRVLPAQ